MHASTVVMLVSLLPAAAARADEPALQESRFQVALAGSLGPHVGIAAHYSPVRPLALGVELALTHDAGGTRTNGAGTTVSGLPPRTARWALATAKANLFPSAQLSPYAVAAYGVGSFEERGETQTGKGLALGAGLDVRLGARATVFVEGRLGVMDVLVAGEDPWIEAPIRVGLRLRL